LERIFIRGRFSPLTIRLCLDRIQQQIGLTPDEVERELSVDGATVGASRTRALDRSLQREVLITVNKQVSHVVAQTQFEGSVDEQQVQLERLTDDCWSSFLTTCVDASRDSVAYAGVGVGPFPTPVVVRRVSPASSVNPTASDG
jgi:hypothetical protein